MSALAILIRSPLLLLPVMSVPLAAQEAESVQDSIEVAGDELSNNGGRIAVNIAAGNQNQQLGTATIAIGDFAITRQSAEQLMGAANLADRSTSISVGPGALSNNSGMVSLNLTAGLQNQSANLATLTVANSGVVSDQMLAQASAPTDPAGPSAQAYLPRNDSIDIDETAFGGNSGLVQMNVVGGERNSSANTFALNISAGGEP